MSPQRRTAAWQQELIDPDPPPVARGLLHSDACQVLNWVNGTAYPRHHFTNVSGSVALLAAVVGPKG